MGKKKIFIKGGYKSKGGWINGYFFQLSLKILRKILKIKNKKTRKIKRKKKNREEVKNSGNATSCPPPPTAFAGPSSPPPPMLPSSHPDVNGLYSPNQPSGSATFAAHNDKVHGQASESGNGGQADKERTL